MMSQLLIPHYLNQLADLRKVSGTNREMDIRDSFNAYRFADYKEKVIDLLAQVTTVSVRTQAIAEAMHATVRLKPAAGL